MTAGGEGIREQLMRLLGIKSRNEERSPRPPVTDERHRSVAEKSGRRGDGGLTDQSWKEGVRHWRSLEGHAVRGGLPIN